MKFKPNRSSKELEQMPKSLVKFLPAESGLDALKAGTLRWHAPHLLSEPFGFDKNSSLSFDRRDLLGKLVQLSNLLIFDKAEPVGNSPMLIAIKRWREQDRFKNREEATPVLTQLLAKMVQQQYQEIEKIYADWQGYASSILVSCFCDSHNRLPAWDRYADRHQGLALCLQCADFSALSDPYRVVYNSKLPEIISIKDQMNFILKRQPSSPQDYFYNKMITKSQDFSAENEYRCFQECGEGEDVGHIPFKAKQLSAVYIGALMKDEDEQQVINLVKENYPQTRVYQTLPSKEKFELEFIEITAAVRGK